MDDDHGLIVMRSAARAGTQGDKETIQRVAKSNREEAAKR